jgi:hypothetical protein
LRSWSRRVPRGFKDVKKLIPSSLSMSKFILHEIL